MRVLCTMINGTLPFGFLGLRQGHKHFKWMDSDAVLARTLREHFGDAIEFVPFVWSGQNSHRARLAAARELSAHLARAESRVPGAHHILLAHSHGGSVALCALRDLPNLMTRSSLVAFGSTFLLPRARHSRLIPGQGTRAFKFQMGYIISLPLFYVVLQFTGALGFYRTMVAMLLAAMPIFCIPWRRIDVSIRRRIRDRSRRLVNELSVASCRDVPMLNLVIRGDEARSWLGALRRISDMCFAVAWATSRALLALSTITAIAMWWAGSAIIQLFPNATGLLIALWVASVGVPVLVLAVPIPLIFIMGVTRGVPLFGFGESLMDGMVIDMILTTTPPSRAASSGVLTYPSGGVASWEAGFQWLAHSRILFSATVARRVVKWLDEGVR